MDLPIWTFHRNGIIQYVPSVSGFFHLACFHGSSLLQMYPYFILMTKYAIVGIYDSPFIHLSRDEQLGSFYMLPLVKGAAMKVLIQVFIWLYLFSILLGIYPRMELLGHMVTVFGFEEPPKCFPWQLHHFTFSSATYGGFNFSTSSPILGIFCVFEYSHPSECEVVKVYTFLTQVWDVALCAVMLPFGFMRLLKASTFL